MNALDVPDDFRGPTMPSLASRISLDGYIDAARIGTATTNLIEESNKWLDRGPSQVVRQELRCLWHVLVQFGNHLQ